MEKTITIDGVEQARKELRRFGFRPTKARHNL